MSHRPGREKDLVAGSIGAALVMHCDRVVQATPLQGGAGAPCLLITADPGRRDHGLRLLAVASVRTTESGGMVLGLTTPRSRRRAEPEILKAKETEYRHQDTRCPESLWMGHLGRWCYPRGCDPCVAASDSRLPIDRSDADPFDTRDPHGIPDFPLAALPRRGYCVPTHQPFPVTACAQQPSMPARPSALRALPKGIPRLPSGWSPGRAMLSIPPERHLGPLASTPDPEIQ
jgi:hypothetical protein